MCLGGLEYVKILNMVKFWIWQGSQYASVTQRYVLTEFWIYLRFKICQDPEYSRILNMRKLHRVLNMPQYGWICQNMTWICLNMSEFTKIDKVLSMSYILNSARSLYKVNEFWFRERSIQNLANELT